LRDANCDIHLGKSQSRAMSPKQMHPATGNTQNTKYKIQRTSKPGSPTADDASPHIYICKSVSRQKHSLPQTQTQFQRQRQRDRVKAKAKASSSVTSSFWILSHTRNTLTDTKIPLGFQSLLQIMMV